MKAKRHAKLLELIHNNDIYTQEDLMRHLQSAGFDVTQATVSRDIKELRLVKMLSGNGKYKIFYWEKNQQDQHHQNLTHYLQMPLSPLSLQ